MNKQFERGTVGGGQGGNFRRGVTGATYSRQGIREQMAAAQERSEQAPQRPSQPAQRSSQPQNRDAKARKRNKYGARCVRCGGYVPAEQGWLAGSRETGWGAEHEQPCPIDEVVAEAKKQDEAQEQGRNVVNGETLYDGKYTLEVAPSGGHRTFRLRTQDADSDFMPGVQIISFLSGADNETDYTRFGHVKNGRLSVWKRFRDNQGLVKDAEEFMADPNSENVIPSVQCFRCHRDLTVPASVHNGLGPECAKRV